MKRKWRIAALVLTVCLLCTALCGCFPNIDELRTVRGSYDADYNILLDGATYRLLPYCETFVPTPDDTENLYSPTVYVAEPDVPLLLVKAMGTGFFRYHNGAILREESDHTGFYYCRSDLYDTLAQRIEKTPAFVDYCYEYSCPDEEQGEITKTYTLTDTEAHALEAVMETVEWEADYAPKDYSSHVSVMLCTEDRLFREYQVDIYHLPNGEFLISTEEIGSGDYLIQDTVPAEWTEAFTSLTKAAKDAEKAWEDYYDSW